LVALYLQEGKLDAALQVLREPAKGAIAQATGVDSIEPKLKLETQRMQLQALVQSVSKGQAQLAATDVSKAIESMKTLADQTGDPQSLTRSLMSLAADLQSQLEANQDPAQQAKLADAFQILVDQLVGLSSDAAALDSIGSAMMLLASNLQTIPNLAAKVPGLMQSAEQAFNKLAALPAEQLQAIGRKPEELSLKMALAKRGAGKFEEAHRLLIQGLQQNPNNITIQMEAARNLQQWAAGKDADRLKQAMLGAEPQANKKKLVWGWGQVAQTTSRYPNFQAEFFEARLNIARCRSTLGDLESDRDQKQKLYEAAINDIAQTHLRFPELGGKGTMAEFDRLLREVQQKAGKPATGLAGIQKPPPGAPKN
jgi:hypothetical protein